MFLETLATFVRAGGWRVDLTEVTTHSYGADALTTQQALDVAGGGAERLSALLAPQTNFEVEVELEPAARDRWLALGSAAEAPAERALAEALAAILGALSPIERTDARPNPGTPAPALVREAARDALRRCGGSGRFFPGTMPVGMGRRHVPDVQRRPSVRRADAPPTNRGDAAAATWLVRGRRVAAGDAAATSSPPRPVSRGRAASQPRSRRDSSPRNIHVAATPRPSPTE